MTFDEWKKMNEPARPKRNFLDALKGVDWYYEYSDDAEVWRRGHDQVAKVVGRLNKAGFTRDEAEELLKAIYKNLPIEGRLKALHDWAMGQPE